MTNDQMRDFSICEIIQDLKAILDCLQTCVSNNVNVAIYQAVNPYLCSFVYSGFDYLEKQNIILKISDKSFKKKVGKSRSKFLKQYMEFNQGTFNKLNDFNRNEYVKFFCKKYPNLSPVISKDINNYYIASINDKPIDNYHLSSGILGCEIGSYLDDITPQVQSFIYQMTRFIVQILISAHIEPINNTHKISFPKIKYNDINMAYGYKNFGIQNNPPILMAFLDILCTVNSYNEVFVKINSYKRLDLKVKYLILFGSVIGLKKLMIFCHNNEQTKWTTTKTFNQSNFFTDMLIKTVLQVSRAVFLKNFSLYFREYLAFYLHMWYSGIIELYNKKG